MKKRGILLLLVATLLLIDMPTQAATMEAPAITLRADHTTAVRTLFSRPRRGIKSRRGGLFNTGLFRKKNACGCPKH